MTQPSSVSLGSTFHIQTTRARKQQILRQETVPETTGLELLVEHASCLRPSAWNRQHQTNVSNINKFQGKSPLSVEEKSTWVTFSLYFQEQLLCQKKESDIFKILKESKSNDFISRKIDFQNIMGTDVINIQELREYWSHEPFLRNLLNNKFQSTWLVRHWQKIWWGAFDTQCLNS